MSIDTMEVLVQVQNVALDPATTEETLRDMLISTLELVEKDQNLLSSMKRLQESHEQHIEALEASLMEQTDAMKEVMKVIAT